MNKRWNRIAKGPERYGTRAFVCTHTIGVSVPPLHRESTDSLLDTTLFIER